MSFICRVVIGYFDLTAACERGRALPTKPLAAEQVSRLQAACDELFGIELRLGDFLTDEGTICIVSGLVSRGQYRAACIAHELFGMSAADVAHRCSIYPSDRGEAPDLESLVAHWRSARPDWGENRVRAQAASTHAWIVAEREFERETQERVRAFATRWRFLA